MSNPQNAAGADALKARRVSKEPSASEQHRNPFDTRGHRWLFVSMALIALIIFGLASPAHAIQTQVKPTAAPANESVASNIDTLVFCPQPFQSELTPWLNHRRQQGHQIQVLAPLATAAELKQQIATVATKHHLKHLVLIGDAYDRDANPKHLVPTEYVLSRATFKLGAEPDIATDNPFADLDGDSLPDIGVGRIPVDSVSELKQFIQRVIAYETHGVDPNSISGKTTPDLPWQQRMNLIAGVGGFGKLADNLIEQVAKKVITEMIPDTLQTSMTYGSWSSPYCPNPERFSASALERFNEGCLFWVYLGHGDRCRLDEIHVPNRSHSILDASNIQQLNCRSGNPIAVFLACYINAFDGDRDCLGEMMLRQPNGPIAAFGGSRVTMPAGMGLLSMAMLDEYFNGSAETLGEVILKAKLEMIRGDQEFDGYRELIESLSATMLPGQTFADECADHIQLMQLLGDPLLRVKRAQQINFTTAKTATAGDTIELSGAVAQAANQPNGPLQIRLCYQRDRTKHRFKRRREFASTPAELAKFQVAYEQARDLVCVQQTATMVNGKFKAEINLPEFTHGDCVITCTMSNGNHVAAGSAKIKIKKLPEQK